MSAGRRARPSPPRWGEAAAGARLMTAIERVLADRNAVPPDLGGAAGTKDVTDAVIGALSGANA